MKNKKLNQKEKAFTLIELLAVLVILAVIALIAVPIILGIVNQARKDAFIRSTELVVSSTDIDMAVADYVYGHTYTMTDGKIEDLKIGIQNTKGMSGTIQYGTDGIAEYALHNNAWCVKKTKAMEKAEVTEYKEEDCVIEVEPPVVATNEECFTFNEDLKSILNYTVGDNCPTDVVIPSTIKGVPVERIGLLLEDLPTLQLSQQSIEKLVEQCGDSLENCHAFWEKGLTSVVIPNGVTSIGPSAFENNQLIRVEIPPSVTSIGDWAFYKNQLTSVEIPSSVTSIGKSAFSDNQLPDEQAFIYAREEDGREDKTTIVSYGGAKRDNVKIPSGVTSIGDWAFSYNQLTSIVITSGVTSIGNHAFDHNQLTSIEIPSSVTSIGVDAFASNQLTSVTIQGKSSRNDFTSYPYPSPFARGWADDYSDANITWNG